MRAIILAAGYATRLYPLTENFPKPLLPVNGKPILDWLIDDVKDVVDEIVIVTNHKFISHFQDWLRGREFVLIDDGTENNEERLGAVKDLQLAARITDTEYLVMAGDNLLDFSLLPFIEFSRGKNTSCIMCYEEDDPVKRQRTGIITVDENQRITSFEEKPDTPKGSLAVPPFYYYKKADMDRIEEALADGCKIDAPGSLAQWLSGKVDMHAWKMTGKRYDIGDKESYEYVKMWIDKIGG